MKKNNRIKTTLFSILTIICSFTNAQVQIGEDIDGEARDNSGYALSMNSNGNIVAIGAPSGSEGTGLVRIFTEKSGTWIQLGGDINGINSSDRLGLSLSLSADGYTVAIGGYTSRKGTGVVRIYHYESKKWTQLGSDINGQSENEFFGYSVSTSDNGRIVAIGAPLGPKFGKVRVYQYESEKWRQLGTDIEEEADHGNLGNSLSLSADGTILAIGNSGSSQNYQSNGTVRVYQYLSNSWAQVGASINGKSDHNFLGLTVKLSADANTLVIGAEKPNQKGQVQVYKNKLGTWIQFGGDIQGWDSEDNFGQAINLSADASTIVIGAEKSYKNGKNSGSIGVYKNISGTWTPVITNINGTHNEDNFGHTVSLSADGTIVAIGAPQRKYQYNSGSNYGYVKVYDLSKTKLNVQKTNYGTAFTVYPNPSNIFTNIQLGATYATTNIEVYSVLGKQVYTQQYKNTAAIKLNTQQFAIGIYTISIQSGTKAATVKLVVE